MDGMVLFPIGPSRAFSWSVNKIRRTKTMTRTMIRTFAMTLAAGAVISANAYIPETGDLVVNIPFQFEAGGKPMPAGEYIVRFDADQTSLRI